MADMKSFGKKWLWPLALAALLLIICGLSLLGFKSKADMLLSQQAAERWRGENETPFAQISCFMPVGGSLSEEEIYNFRTAMVTKLTEASFEVTADTPLIHDAWCGFGKATISNGQRRGDVQVTAVGGNFFDFHPIKLVSGNYLSPDDLMEDRVLLDRECAWLLFGGEELTGMSFQINGQPYYVAGVIERETDKFSQKALGDTMGIYMSWQGWKKLSEDAGISCYELVMAEPVEGFCYRAATEKFPIGRGEIVDNTYRYEPERILKMLKDGSDRSMRLSEASYPYWENAARAVEDSCLVWLVAALIAGLMPAVLLLYFAIKALVFSKAKLEDEYVPSAKEKISEAWRVRARKRWEKKNPGKK